VEKVGIVKREPMHGYNEFHMTDHPLDLILSAVQARIPALDDQRLAAVRLFNGFYEGCPDLALDVYADTLVVFNYREPPAAGEALITPLVAALREQFPWLSCGLVKDHHAASPAERQGRLLFGERPAHKIMENDVWYALDLRLNQDAGLYIDSRGLRGWLKAHSAGWSVLNTFAYTGSLGVAALAGGAVQVVQTDLNRRFLNLAKESCLMNGLPIHKEDYHPIDFFDEVAALKRRGELFDCVILDPPFFSTTTRGQVDLARSGSSLINKVRPLVKDGGWLVAVNNALFVSGAEYMASLQALCADGYLEIAETIPVPEDFCGYASTRVASPPVDPAPFNHPTKIALLKVNRK
jgi:23S rRNA (cytosine1962-C5)-methyltransferase